MIFGSLALLADGWHMSTHAAALAIAALAYRYARQRKSDRSLPGTRASSLRRLVARSCSASSRSWWRMRVSCVRCSAADPIWRASRLRLLAFYQSGERLAAAGRSSFSQPPKRSRASSPPSRQQPAGGLCACPGGCCDIDSAGSPAFDRKDVRSGLDRSIRRHHRKSIRNRAIDARFELVLIDAAPCPTRHLRVAPCTRLETAGDLVSDLHVWQIGPGHCAAIVSIVTDRPQTPAAYKARLADLDRLSHVTVEVSPCPHRHDHDSA